MADVDDPWEPPFFGPLHVEALAQFARRDAIKRAIADGTASDEDIISIRQFEGHEDIDASMMSRINAAPDEAKALLWYIFHVMVDYRWMRWHHSAGMSFHDWGLKSIQVFLSQLSDGLTADEIRHEILENWGVKGTKMYDAQALTSQYGGKRQLWSPSFAKEMDDRRAELEAEGVVFDPDCLGKGIQCTPEGWAKTIANRKKYSN